MIWMESRKTISGEMQQAVLNVHQQCSPKRKDSSKNKRKALKLHRHTVERIIKRGFAQKSKIGENLKTHEKLSEVDNYWKSLIRQTIFGFYREKVTPTLDIFHAKLSKISKGT